MEKQILVETQLFKPLTLTEGKISERGNPIVEGILATVEVKNGNGRYYKKDLWERELDKYSKIVKDNRAVGELDHPDSSVINLKNVSHNIKDFWWDGDNIMGKIEILPTPSGNILKALVDSGVTVGVSSRGMGSLKDKDGVLQQFLSKSEIKENHFKESIKIIAKISPSFAYSIFEKYIRAYCDGKVNDVIPFNIIELKKISGQTFKIQKELLEGFIALSKSDKNAVLNMFMGK